MDRLWLSRCVVVGCVVLALAAGAGAASVEGGTAPPAAQPVAAAQGGPLTGIAAISAGEAHTCAVTSAGGLRCWGSNRNSQLGRGILYVPITNTTPVDVVGLDRGITAVAAGGFQTCALRDTGGVTCWGVYHWYTGRSGGMYGNPTPTDVPGLSNGVTAITTGWGHACALMQTGGVKCWGTSGWGQLGGAAPAYSNVPVDVAGLSSGVTAIAAGDDHSCALLAAGGVKCWGRNLEGQLGNGAMDHSRSTPVDVSGLSSGVVAIAAGGTHSCALLDTDAMKCWGDGVPAPAEVAGPGSGAAALTAGGGHTCALTAAGGVRCWGRNDWGQVGDGTNDQRAGPVEVVGLSSGVAAVDAGGEHTCALLDTGEARCWGRSEFGQLGNGTTTDRHAPVEASGLEGGAQALAAGRAHNCAISLMGALECWGDNEFGALGDGLTADRYRPAEVLGLGGGVARVAAGDFHTCAALAAGGVKCWGSNLFGQLGDGTTTHRYAPVDVAGLSGKVNWLAAGEYHTCAVTAAGEAWCWGDNSHGQLGDGTTVERHTPVLVSGLGGAAEAVAMVAAGRGYTCALTAGGRVLCWGLNLYGYLGDGTLTSRATPVEVLNLGSGVLSLAVGDHHACAVPAGGWVACWGQAYSGELGHGVAWSATHTPVGVMNLPSGVRAVTAGGFHSCALTTAGGVKCWGRHLSGQLGWGPGLAPNQAAPVNVSGLSSGAVALAAGEAHTCAALAAGAVWCWGRNASGELGLDPGWTPQTVIEAYRVWVAWVRR
jgi:alpha-tubulin suppressor-like RCC1 family protein